MTHISTTAWTQLSAAAVLVLLTACAKGTQPPAPAADATQAPAPAAIVDGTAISREAYEFYLKNLAGKSPVELTPEQKGQVLDEMIGMQLIAAQGVKDGIEKDPEVAGRLEMARMRLMADAESQKYLKGKERCV